MNVGDVVIPAVEETRAYEESVYEDHLCHPECYAGLGGIQVCLFDDDDDVSGGIECVGDGLENLGVVTDQVVCQNDDMVPSMWKVCDGNVPAKLQSNVSVKPQEENAPNPPLSVLPPSNDYGATPSPPPIWRGPHLVTPPVDHSHND